ncbi:MAG: DEAD/DEAH box helicase [Ignavibacteriaceae bacterium]|nr:DEAD/DEAH box helicase [Ignavibacteriaceae bacterium]
MSKFKELGVTDSVIKAIEELGFVEPTKVQAEVIPYLLENPDSDVMVLAQTGTGKTAAYSIPIIQKLNVNAKHIQHIILSPTRELCLQIADDLTSYTKYIDGIKIAAIFGGSGIDRQISKIKKGANIISATPGRLMDLMDRGVIDLSEVDTVVLDEADEMLNMGFREDLDKILETTPKTRKTRLFSASMSKEIQSIAYKHMHNPKEIIVGKRNSGAETVEHYCYFVQAKDRYLALKRIVDYNPEIYGIVFCRTKRETQEVADLLINDGYNADALHGDLSQAQREIVMNKFRIKHLKLLVATDVAARGIDVESLTHIINYNLPDEIELYTHRSGRTGRAGKTGISIVIANLKEKGKISHIEKVINKKFTISEVPGGKEICEKQLFRLIDKVEKVEVDTSQIEPFLPEIFRKLEWLDREELIKKFVSVEFNRFLEYYKGNEKLKTIKDTTTFIKDKKGFSGFTRFFINVGKKDGIKPGTLMAMINEFTGIGNIEIGDIEILGNFTFFEADGDYSDIIMNSFKSQSYKGRGLSVEIAQSNGVQKRDSRDKYRGGKFKKSNKFAMSMSGNFEKKKPGKRKFRN